MKILSLINEKGGVGKTTLATHIAAGLAIRGYRVVLADADPQGHATVSMGLKKEPCFYDLLVRDAAFKDVLRRVPAEVFSPENEAPKGELYVLPSNLETRSIPNQISDPFAAADRFRELEDVIDYVIFDTSPTPSLLHGSIYLATDAILYPTKSETLSFDGLIESLTHRVEAQTQRKRWGMDNITILGIVPTMYRSATLVHQENYAKLKTAYGELVWPPIAMRTVWAEASSVGMLVYRYAPESEGALECWSLVNRVIQGLGV
ncbi:MAG: ParA family protein [Chloroflexi bacterium]|nr:ParA family protein [Chloroflexota bacterium]